MAANYSFAAQTYIWHQKFAEEGLDLNEHLEDIFVDASFAGIPTLEFSIALFDTDDKLDRLRALTEKHNIAVPLYYAGGDFHEPAKAQESVQKILHEARRVQSLGCVGITTNPSPKPPGAGKTSNELKTQAEALNKLGAGLKDLGIQLYYHTHDPEIRHNAREFRTTCDLSDPNYVKLCYDVHWVYRGGADPIALMEQYADRMGTLHVRNSHDTIWDESFGEGDIDYADIHRILSENNFTGPVILELAYEAATPRTRSLRDNLKLGMNAMQNIFGAG